MEVLMVRDAVDNKGTFEDTCGGIFLPSQSVAGDVLPGRMVCQGESLPKYLLCSHREQRISSHQHPKVLLFYESSC